jgi:hypothetical protein
MGLFDNFQFAPLPPKWKAEADLWQDRYFPELPEVQDAKRWSRHYPGLPVTRLESIMAKPEAFAGYASKAVGADARTSDLSWRVWKAADLHDDQFQTALKIIRAQASTELGSIQQHRMVYEKLDHGGLSGMDEEVVEGIHNVSDRGQDLESISFSKKRVCVEELRHHYQMSAVLTLDPTWDEKRRWGHRWGTETMEELFAMKPGEHVLDAFNIEFQSLLDSATFLALIDRVGKYQLEMQCHFYYGPMATSMPFMRWLEESYHLAAGETLLRAAGAAAILDGANFGVEDIQRRLNMWFPRGLEMFGSELGGANVKGLFKTLGNREAQDLYVEEVRGKVKDINLSIVAAKVGCTRDAAEPHLARILAGETVHGLTTADLLKLPHRRFHRIRGLTEYGDFQLPGRLGAGVGFVYLPFDLDGTLMTDGGRPIEREAYMEYLRTVLPPEYMRSRHWEFVKRDFLFSPTWGDPVRVTGAW